MAITSTLYLYKNFTPNLGRGEHFYFDDIEDYMTAISSHLFIYEPVDNYRITGLILRLPYSLPAAGYGNITYIIEKVQLDGSNALYHCYHVKSAVFVSNFMEFTLTRDLWADYITKASLDNIFLQRANRLPIGYVGGRYDNVEFTKTKALSTYQYINYTPLGSHPADLTNIYVCFTVAFLSTKTRELINGMIAASDVKTYCVDPYIYGTGYGSTPPTPSVWLETVIEAIAGIYGNKVGSDINEAYVTNIYIVYGDYIPIRLASNEEFKTISGIDFTSNHGLYTVEPSIANVKYELTQSQSSVLYFGTPTAMLELPRSISLEANIECIAKRDGIELFARCGDSQLDITQAFSVTVPTTQGPPDKIEKVARNLSTIGTLAGAAANIYAGNVIGGGLSIASALVPHDKAPNAQYKNNGDGYVTWKRTRVPSTTSDYNLRYPIGITEYPSIDSAREVANVTKYGAIYNAYFNTLAEIIGGNALTSDVAANHTYVKATIDVENAPLDACEYIAQEFANGLEIIEL